MTKITMYLLIIFVAAAMTANFVHADCGVTGAFVSILERIFFLIL